MNSDNNNKSNNKKKVVRKNKKDPTTSNQDLSDAAEATLDQRVRELRRQAMSVLEGDSSESASGTDKIAAIRTILSIEGYDSKTLADGWRKQNGFHRF
jgi:hypothetical protein